MTLEDQLDQLLRHDPTALEPLDLPEDYDFDPELDVDPDYTGDLDSISIDDILR